MLGMLFISLLRRLLIIIIFFSRCLAHSFATVQIGPCSELNFFNVFLFNAEIVLKTANILQEYC